MGTCCGNENCTHSPDTPPLYHVPGPSGPDRPDGSGTVKKEEEVPSVVTPTSTTSRDDADLALVEAHAKSATTLAMLYRKAKAAGLIQPGKQYQ